MLQIMYKRQQKINILKILQFFRQDLFIQEVKKYRIIQQIPLQNLQSIIQKMSSTCNNNKFFNDDNLCSTFEGLFKNGKQQQQITMSTAWNYLSSTNSINNADQLKIKAVQQTQNNQNQKQKKTYFQGQKEITNIQNTKSSFKNITQQKINPHLIILQKQSIISKRTLKISKLKTLLPYYYNVKIPESYKKLLIIAQKIDHYLIQKRQLNFYMDNIFNIFRRLFQNEQMSQIWSNVKKIMFLQEDYYKINVDPMKNLVLGIKQKKDIKIHKRKQKIRKTIVDYYIINTNNQNNNQIVPEIAEIIIQPIKTAKFYLENMDLASSSTNILNISEQPETPKLKQQFIQSLKYYINQKQIQHLSLTSAQSLKSSPNSANISQFKHFCQTIQQIYIQKKVKNMYKASLIDCLRKTSKFQLTQIFKLIKIIIKEQLFLEVLIKPNFCQIFHIIPQQKEKLIQFYQIKNKTQML